MDELIKNYFDSEKESLLRDYKYRSRNQTWLNRAYAVMLQEEGFLSEAEYKTIDKGLVEIQESITQDDLLTAEHGQDIFFYYEQALYKQIGVDVGCKLHVGRSRNDMYFTMYRMSMREAIWQLAEEILKTQEFLEEKVSAECDTVIPYYTYGQPAQPGTWGHYLISIHKALEQDLNRLRNAYKTINQCPMGAGAGIGSAFHLNKYRLAELLGFDGAIENTVIANSAVDYYLELEAAIAILNTTLGRVGGDLDFFASMECNILDGDSLVCSGSSIMPQKKNYGLGATLRSQAIPFYGYLMNSLATAGSVSMFPIYETFSFFDAFWENVHNVISNIKNLRLALEHSTIRTEVAYARARDGFTAATHMAEQLTMEVGEPFVKTHHIVGNMIHKLMDEDRLSIDNMTSELMKEASVKAVGFTVERTDAQIAEMLDPLASLNAKVTGGTPKPDDTRKLLADGQAVRKENRAWLSSVLRQAEDAFAMVERGIG